MKRNYFLAILLLAALSLMLVSACSSTNTSTTSVTTTEVTAEELALDEDADAKENLADDAAEFPAKFDLRDLGLVSSVKFQNPWGTCWGFGSTAAAEISILAELRDLLPEQADKLADPNCLDLSEMQLVWFAANPLPDDFPGGQGGEGAWLEGNYPLNAGGASIITASIYSSGTGPVFEESIPYRNHENVLTTDAKGRTYYAAVHEDDPSVYYDWSVPDDERFVYAFELQDSNILPLTHTQDDAGNYVFNEEGVRAVKDQLMNHKRGVSVAYCADTFIPNSDNEDAHALYINSEGGTWAHYTWSEDGMPVASNHVVCIVGWDDEYSRDNFLADHKPPADGAFIVKNSWGAATNEVPNKNEWGVDGSGYFYLSYYDMSIDDLESFNFEVERDLTADFEQTYVEQYDYMPASAMINLPVPQAKIANVFTAEEDFNLRAVGLQLNAPDMTAWVNVYLLKDGFASPEDGELISHFETTFHNAGFHRLLLPEKVSLPKGSKYAVVVQETTEDGGSQVPLTIAASEIETPMGGVIHRTAVVNKGESYAFANGQWQDWTETLSGVREMMAAETGEAPEGIGLVFDNPPIKAYADPLDGTKDGSAK